MFAGIEIGGTKLQLGVGPGDGTLLGLWRGNVDPAAGAAGIHRQILQAVPELLSRAGLDPAAIQGIGVGFGGPVDDLTQSVITSHQIHGWDNFPLAMWLTENLGKPAVLGNDADVAGLAEALFGAGRGYSPVFYITVGSGIGGGFVVEGMIQRGTGRGAAEIGHLRVPSRGELLPLEQVASGWAIGQRATRVVGRQTDARELAALAAAGDGVARELLYEALKALAEAICHVIALICPRRIVIGGGVSLIGEELFFGPLRRFVAERVFRPFADCYEIVPAALGEEVAVHGALALARQRR